MFDVMLYDSAVCGNLEGAKAALTNGGRVGWRSYQGFTPLLSAAAKGHTDICRLLLVHSSNVNEMDPNAKQSALHNAAIKGHQAVVEALLSWGAALDQQDDGGYTPLFVACQEGHLPCVLTLLKAGASIPLPNNSGDLPIHAATEKNRVEIVRTLLELGCSPDAVSYSKIIFNQQYFQIFLSGKRHEGGYTSDVCSRLWS